MADIGITEEGIVVAGILQLTWDEIDKTRNLFRFKNSVLVKVGFKYGRVSDIMDTQIYDRDEWAKIKAALDGTTAWFSDFAGKHSETSVNFWTNIDVEETTDIKKIVEFFEIHGWYEHDLGIVQSGLEQAEENGEIDSDYNKINQESDDDPE